MWYPRSHIRRTRFPIRERTRSWAETAASESPGAYLRDEMWQWLAARHIRAWTNPLSVHLRGAAIIVEIASEVNAIMTLVFRAERPTFPVPTIEKPCYFQARENREARWGPCQVRL